ncbi:indole-3-acetaldehyde oxidase [Plakobranchus ocellatus]|uniref:Indole-3-acetaldehyde oxidase n=1 Tax=Plakobranchus ocellatus TaxID=259542 RepID=A0AAV4CMM1_9GAST|nr:indole-3-acetaldehyde oxidase [Plakobranchus ocellatus]
MECSSIYQSVVRSQQVESALMACDDLQARLQPVREKMPDADWKTRVLNASFLNIQLSAEAMEVNTTGDWVLYSTYMAGVTETEVDVLTGEYTVRRVDIMADLGHRFVLLVHFVLEYTPPLQVDLRLLGPLRTRA